MRRWPPGGSHVAQASGRPEGAAIDPGKDAAWRHRASGSWIGLNVCKGWEAVEPESVGYGKHNNKSGTQPSVSLMPSSGPGFHSRLTSLIATVSPAR